MSRRISISSRVSNIDAIINSISTDGQVARWFLLLLTLPKIKSRLEEDIELRDLYACLDRITFWQNMLVFILFIFAFLFVYLNQYLLLEVVLVVLLSFLLMKLFRNKKKYIARISRKILLDDFGEKELEYKTLYHVCEIYSRKYNIPSFVDVSFSISNICVYVMMITILMVDIVMPVHFWLSILIIIVVFGIVIYILNIKSIYIKL